MDKTKKKTNHNILLKHKEMKRKQKQKFLCQFRLLIDEFIIVVETENEFFSFRLRLTRPATAPNR